MPKVSIILTSYNHEIFLRQAIDSVLNQTFSDFELFIWDDASSDGSWEMIRSYIDPRIKLYCNEEQKRAVYGVNKVISEFARGEYIAIHHSDDIWEPDKLKKQVKFLDEYSEYGAVFTNAMAINEEGSPLQDKEHFYYSIFDQPNRTRYEWLNYFFYHGNALCHPSVLIRKKCYDDCGLYNYGLAQIADYDMWIRLCLKYEIHILEEKLVRFRVRDNEANTSGNKPEARIRGLFELYQTRKYFLQIQSEDQMLAVFPESLKYHNDKGFEAAYILAMCSLEPKAWINTKMFGLSLLYDLVNNKEKADKIKEIYNFDYINLIQITALHDIFSVEEINDLINQRDRIMEDRNGIAEERNRIINSDLYKLSNGMRGLLTKLHVLFLAKFLLKLMRRILN